MQDQLKSLNEKMNPSIVNSISKMIAYVLVASKNVPNVPIELTKAQIEKDAHDVHVWINSII